MFFLVWINVGGWCDLLQTSNYIHFDGFYIVLVNLFYFLYNNGVFDAHAVSCKTLETMDWQRGKTVTIGLSWLGFISPFWKDSLYGDMNSTFFTKVFLGTWFLFSQVVPYPALLNL